MAKYRMRIEPHYHAVKGSIVIYHEDPEGDSRLLEGNVEKGTVKIDGIMHPSFSFSMPQRCVCCGEPADSFKKVTYSKSSGGMISSRSWDFPYCGPCINHAELSASFLTSIMKSRNDRAKKIMRESCASIDWAVNYEGWEAMKTSEAATAGPMRKTLEPAANYVKSDEIRIIKIGKENIENEPREEYRIVHIFTFTNLHYAEDFIKQNQTYGRITEVK